MIYDPPITQHTLSYGRRYHCYATSISTAPLNVKPLKYHVCGENQLQRNKTLSIINIKALFGRWILEGIAGEGKAYEEVNPCLRVLKKQGKVLGDFEGLHLSNFKVPPNWGVLGGLNVTPSLII